MTTIEMGCPACGAVPGTAHSLACDDADEFERRKGERERREHEAGLAAAQLATARAELRDAMDNAQRAGVELVRGGVSEVEAARRVGITRKTLREALGK